MKYKYLEEYNNSDDDTMPIFCNEWELENSYNYGNYDYHMPGLMNRCEMDDSSDDERDKCDNVKNNEYWSEKGLDCDDDLSE